MTRLNHFFPNFPAKQLEALNYGFSLKEPRLRDTHNPGDKSYGDKLDILNNDTLEKIFLAIFYHIENIQ